MRRILSATAALVLAFGVVLLGASAAGADTVFTSSGMPGYVYPGESVTVGGTLPAGDLLTGLTYTVAPGTTDPGTPIPSTGSSCFSDISASDRVWSCTATLPSDLVAGSAHDLLSNYHDNADNAQTINSTFNVDAVPAPQFTVVSDTTSTRAISTGVGADAGQPASGEVDITTLPSTSSGTCEYSGSPIGCTAVSSNTGLHVAVTRQDLGTGGPSSFGTNIYYTVPSTPTVTSGTFSAATGKVTISGSGGTVSDSVHVFEASTPVCQATVQTGGAWSCVSDNAIAGYHSYYAYQVDGLQASDYSTGQVPNGADYQTGAYSASSLGTANGSIDVGDGATLPTTAYVFSPGAVQVTPTATGGATSVAVQVFEEVEGTDQGRSDCNVDAVCTASGLNGGSVFKVLTTQTFPNTTTTALTQYFYVPSPPEGPTVADNGDFTAQISGTGSVGDKPSVYQLETPNDTRICGPLAALMATPFDTWSCTSPTQAGGGEYGFLAAVSNDSVGAAAIPNGAIYVPGGLSPLSDESDVTLDDPSAVPFLGSNYSFNPGYMQVTPTFTGGAGTGTMTLASADGDTQTCTWGTEYYNDTCYPDTSAGPATLTISQSWSDDPDRPATSATFDFTIPATPVITGETTDSDTGVVTFTGTGTPGFMLEVDYSGDGYAQACVDPVTVQGDGTWSCDTPAEWSNETTSYFAFQTDPATEGDAGFLAGAESSYSDDVEYPVSLPLTEYRFLPGADVSVHGTPTSPSTKVELQLYSTESGEGIERFPQSGCPGFDDEGNDLGFEPTPVGAHTCTFTNLDPGVWELDSYQDTEDDFLTTGAEDYFVIPETPAVTAATVSNDGAVTANGTGVDGDRVYVVSTKSALPICDTVVSDNAWSCTSGGLSEGQQTISAYQVDQVGVAEDYGLTFDFLNRYVAGGTSAVSSNDDSIAVTVSGESSGSTPVPGTSAKDLITPTWSFDISGLDLGNIHPGDSFTITGTGPAGATLDAELHSTPVTIGTTTVGSDGTFHLTGIIPADTEPGDHHIVVTMTGAGLVPTTSDKAITIVTPAAVVPAAGGQIITTDPSKAADSSGTPTSHIGHINPADPTAPNILTRSINPIQDVIAHPAKIGAAVAIGLVLLIFATLPARLLNATIAENYENLVKRMPRLGRRPKWFDNLSGWLKRTPVASGIILSAVTAFLFGFADPNFGFTLASLRLILGLAIALFIVEYLANAVTGRIIHRAWSLTVQLNIRPLGIVLTIIGVIASRLLHFSPGFLIGLVLGLVLTGKKAEEDAWKAVLVRSSVVLGFGLIAWLGYSALTTGEGGTETFWNELFVEALVAITTEGIVAILVELLPFRLLEGERIWHRSRILWAVLYFFIIAAFVIAVVPWEGNWEALGSSLWIWIGVVAAFAAVCLAIYLFFRFRNPFHESAEEQEDHEPVDIGAGG